MEYQELIEAIERFGLNEREAMMYVSLLRRGRATARELARDAHLDRVLGYRVLDGLRSRGIVEATAERPRRFAALAPRSLFERNLRERRSRLEADSAKARELSAALPTLAREISPDAPRFQVITGTTTLYDYLREMMERSDDDLAVMVTHRGLRDSVGVGLHHWLPRFLRDGGRFRLVVESDPRVRSLLKRFERVSDRYPNAEVRQLWPQPSRMTIVDKSEALVFLVPEARMAQTEEIAVWTDNRDFVNSQLLYFNAVWETAGSASLRPPRARRDSARESRGMRRPAS